MRKRRSILITGKDKRKSMKKEDSMNQLEFQKKLSMNLSTEVSRALHKIKCCGREQRGSLGDVVV